MPRASICACASRGNWPSPAGCNCRSRNLSAPRLANSRAPDGFAPQVMRLSRLRSRALSTTTSDFWVSAPAASAGRVTGAAIGTAMADKTSANVVGNVSRNTTVPGPKRKPISMLFQAAQPKPANDLDVRAEAAVASRSGAGTIPARAAVAVRILGIPLPWDRDRSWAQNPAYPTPTAPTRQACHRHPECVVTLQFISGLAG
jgi:hypothetical protein